MILVNSTRRRSRPTRSSPARPMSSRSLPEVVEKIIEGATRRDPATLGGQTALNTAMALHERGAGDVRLPADRRQRRGDPTGARTGSSRASSSAAVPSPRARSSAHDGRIPFAAAGTELSRRGAAVVHDGRTGSGFAYDEADLRRIAAPGSVLPGDRGAARGVDPRAGRNTRLEVMRDRADNVVVVCSIENLDPMGVHTGDSITVARPDADRPGVPAAARHRHRCHPRGRRRHRRLQHPVRRQPDPDGRVIVIEMNPRCPAPARWRRRRPASRSPRSPRRWPIGYTLDEVPNDITSGGDAGGVRADDRLRRGQGAAVRVREVPRRTDAHHDDEVGRARRCPSGRCFKEALQKALPVLERSRLGFHWLERPTRRATTSTRSCGVCRATDRWADRHRAAAHACRALGGTRSTRRPGSTRGFLDQIAPQRSRRADSQARRSASPDLRGDWPSDTASPTPNRPASRRTPRPSSAGCGTPRRPPVSRPVDTCAAEFAAEHPYHYSAPTTRRRGRPRDIRGHHHPRLGPNRIGQGVEFDYSCVHASFALAGPGYDTVMVNCNPRPSRPTTTPRRGSISSRSPRGRARTSVPMAAGPVAGVIVQLGGQTPSVSPRRSRRRACRSWDLARGHHLAEDRGAFGRVARRGEPAGPKHGTAFSASGRPSIAAVIGYPVLVRRPTSSADAGWRSCT